MIFEAKSRYRWRKRFAFLPKVISYDNKTKRYSYVWLGFYEWRYHPESLYLEFRLFGTVKVSYHCKIYHGAWD